MSTRATYRFEGKDINITYYIHYDGYREGAAVYFRKMLTYPNKRGGWVAQFLRANDNAEFTRGHDFHGDTEYRYTVNGENVTVEAIRTDDWKTWVRLEDMSLVDFVNKYMPEEPPLVSFGGYVMTENDANGHIRHCLEEMWRMKDRGHTGNASSQMSTVIKTVKQIKATIPSFGEAFVAECRSACLDFGEAYRWPNPEEYEKRFVDDVLRG